MYNSDDEFPSESELLRSHVIHLSTNEKNKKRKSVAESDNDLSDVEKLISRIPISSQSIEHKKKKIFVEKESKKSKNDDGFVFKDGKKKYILTSKQIQQKIKNLKRRLNGRDTSEAIKSIIKNFRSTDSFTNFKKRTMGEKSNPKILVTRINDLIPGYYGCKGYEIIYKHLIETVLEDTPLVYEGNKGNRNSLINEVIIPEIAIYLIAKDLKVDHDLGLRILKCSIGYGSHNSISRSDATFGTKKLDRIIQIHDYKICMLGFELILTAGSGNRLMKNSLSESAQCISSSSWSYDIPSFDDHPNT
ncbi:19948_t:CDS:2 [Dentiscutata erythropus]|uniref:19948_t:CDS:1 n=1 Tax=Dentiscutata erythropus TaxID=1348616 RepID=A0A9N9N9U7_9GLOM|nr:19948_t:CDS:2 [Dentiscutata erythropus]